MISAILYAKLLYCSFRVSPRATAVFNLFKLLRFGIVIHTLGLLQGKDSLPRKLLYKIVWQKDNLLDILTPKARKLISGILAQRETFSQDFQDCLAMCLKDSHSLKYFIDIGAYDGITKSNSYALERAGLLGILVEGNQSLVTQISQNRAAKILSYAVVPQDMVKESLFLSFPKSARASSAKLVSASNLNPPEDVRHEVKLISVSNLLEVFRDCFGKDALSRAYVSIDIEGLDFKVLSEIFQLGGKPICISIEHNFDRALMSDIEQEARLNGYSIVLHWLTRNDFFLIRN